MSQFHSQQKESFQSTFRKSNPTSSSQPQNGHHRPGSAPSSKPVAAFGGNHAGPRPNGNNAQQTSQQQHKHNQTHKPAGHAMNGTTNGQRPFTSPSSINHSSNQSSRNQGSSATVAAAAGQNGGRYVAFPASSSAFDDADGMDIDHVAGGTGFSLPRTIAFKKSATLSSTPTANGTNPQHKPMQQPQQNGFHKPAPTQQQQQQQQPMQPKPAQMNGSQKPVQQNGFHNNNNNQQKPHPTGFQPHRAQPQQQTQQQQQKQAQQRPNTAPADGIYRPTKPLPPPPSSSSQHNSKEDAKKPIYHPHAKMSLTSPKLTPAGLPIIHDKDPNSFRWPKRYLYSSTQVQTLLGWKSFEKVGCGLYNLGNTCFLNAVLQSLMYTPPLVNFLKSSEHSRRCRVKTREEPDRFCLFCAMEATCKAMHSHKAPAIQPREIVSHLRQISRSFRLGRQEDSHEFLRFLLDLLQKNDLSSYGGSKRIADLRIQETTALFGIFGGYFRSQVKCLTCQYRSNTYDAFLDLSLEVSEANSVARALQSFTNPEILEGENAYRCSKCNKKVRAQKQLTIFKAPTVLSVHLKRFQFAHAFGGKIGKPISFTERLSLQAHMSDKASNPGYSLYAVLVHSGGSIHSGHYFSFVKSSSGQWHLMDDSSVRQVSVQQVLEQKAYILFYVRDRIETLPIAAPSPAPSPSLGPQGNLAAAAAAKKVAELNLAAAVASKLQTVPEKKPVAQPQKKQQQQDSEGDSDEEMDDDDDEEEDDNSEEAEDDEDENDESYDGEESEQDEDEEDDEEESEDEEDEEETADAAKKSKSKSKSRGNESDSDLDADVDADYEQGSDDYDDDDEEDEEDEDGMDDMDRDSEMNEDDEATQEAQARAFYAQQQRARRFTLQNLRLIPSTSAGVPRFIYSRIPTGASQPSLQQQQFRSNLNQLIGAEKFTPPGQEPSDSDEEQEEELTEEQRKKRKRNQALIEEMTREVADLSSDSDDNGEDEDDNGAQIAPEDDEEIDSDEEDIDMNIPVKKQKLTEAKQPTQNGKQSQSSKRKAEAGSSEDESEDEEDDEDTKAASKKRKLDSGASVPSKPAASTAASAAPTPKKYEPVYFSVQAEEAAKSKPNGSKATPTPSKPSTQTPAKPATTVTKVTSPAVAPSKPTPTTPATPTPAAAPTVAQMPSSNGAATPAKPIANVTVHNSANKSTPTASSNSGPIIVSREAFDPRALTRNFQSTQFGAAVGDWELDSGSREATAAKYQAKYQQDRTNERLLQAHSRHTKEKSSWDEELDRGHVRKVKNREALSGSVPLVDAAKARDGGSTARNLFQVAQDKKNRQKANGGVDPVEEDGSKKKKRGAHHQLKTKGFTSHKERNLKKKKGFKGPRDF